MTDPAEGLSILHVIIRVGPTNSQYNEHCLPVAGTRRISICSLFPSALSTPPSLRLFEGDGTVRGCFRALRRALSSGSYDVVHVHAPASGMLTLAVYLWTRRRRADLVFTVHNSWPNFRRRNRLFLRVVLALFPVVAVCGRAAHDSLPSGVRRRRGDKLCVIPNGVDTARVDSALSGRPGHSARPQGGRTVVGLGRLIPVKDPDTLLAAFSRGRDDDDRLVLVGDGPMRDRLESAARRLAHGRVRFTGVIARDDVYRTLRDADVLVSTSAGEGLPVAVLEAMACGCPVVVSDIGPHREIAERAGCIPLVPVHDTTGFAHELRRLLALSDEERSRLGQRLRRCVATYFSVRTMNHAYGEVYVKVSRHNGAGGIPPTAPGTNGATIELSFPQKLRRRLGLLVTLTLLGGAAGFLFAELQTPEFKGETTLTVGNAIGSATDQDDLDASAAMAIMYADLARRELVLGPVAEQGFARSWRDLQPDVHGQTGDKNPQLVQISVYEDTPAKARHLADAVAAQLVLLSGAQATNPQQGFVAEQIGSVQEQIGSTTQDLATAQRRLAELPTDATQTPDERVRAEALRSRVDDLRATLVELQGGYADLEQLGDADIGRLQVADEAWTARSPLRPTPFALVLAGAGLGFGAVAGWVQLFSRDRRRRPAQSVPSSVPWALPDRAWDDPSLHATGERA